jgi:hypothetical protein
MQARITTCGHNMCVSCTKKVLSIGFTAPICPFCRKTIGGFERAHHASQLL